MGLFKKEETSDDGGLLVYSLFDVGVSQHSPLGFARNMPGIWRQVEEVMKKAVFPAEEYLVYVHGTWNEDSAVAPLQPYLCPVVWTVATRSILDRDALQLQLKEVEKSYAARPVNV